MTDDALVQVRNLEKHYYDNDQLIDKLLRNEPVTIRAVDGVSFDIQKGETLGLVGESGCGKSTTAETLMRLREPTGGQVLFDGENVYELDGDDLDRFRRRAQIMFQDPFSSLDPRMTAGEIIREPLDIHGIGSEPEKRERASELLEQVGLSSEQADRYPHEFSGGQRQRIGFARTLALEPEFVVLDEPVSALDASIQAQVLNLLSEIQDEYDLTYLFIAHDLSVVRHVSDRVAVMYLGEVVEIGATEEIFQNPKHPYTKALLESVPRAKTSEKQRDVSVLTGDVPSPRNPPSGCRFRTRCPQVIPPPDIDLSQEAYREVMEYRKRLEQAEIDVSFIQEQAAADDASFAETLKAKLFTETFDGRDAEVLDRSFEALENDNPEEAIAVLRNRYESICETVSPDIGNTDHAAACHLLDDTEVSSMTSGDSPPAGDGDSAESD